MLRSCHWLQGLKALLLPNFGYGGAEAPPFLGLFSASRLDLQNLVELHDLELVHQEFTVCRQSDREVRQRAGSRSFNLLAVGLELASVTRTLNLPGVFLPLRNAAEVRADRRDRIESAFFGPDDVDLLLLPEGNGLRRVSIGIPRPESR